MKDHTVKGEPMRLLGNIIWIILGGLIISIAWFLLGLLFYITIIGIPLGRQCFKMASLTLTPFGKTIVYSRGAGFSILNIVWALTCGWVMALAYITAGVGNCITIIGIPFGIQSFKIAALAFWPFGSEVVSFA